MIRLAREQGLLTRPSLNYFQHWALLYWLYMDRRTELTDRRAELEAQTFNLFPERWMQLYQDTLAQMLRPEGEEGEEPVTDVEALDRWFEQMVRTGGANEMSGNDYRPSGAGEYWSDWG